MWPVQTLTLLLCLTDEEQLFAQHMPAVQQPVRVEHVEAPVKPSEEEATIEFPVV